MTPIHDWWHHVIHVLGAYPRLRGMRISVSVMGVVAFALANIAMQVSTPNDVSWVEHLTLEGGLIVAVGVLWRALVKKDDQLMQSVRIATEALSANAASNMELRKIIEELVRSKADLAEAVDKLTSYIGHERKV
jgi:Mg2+/Co2+ transporter CorB